MKTKILIADDHTIIREGLKGLFENQIDMEVIGEASDGISVREKAFLLNPDVILMDISMPGLNGMATTRLIKQELPTIHVIGLSVYCEHQFILGMLQAGAEAYLVKSDAFKDVLKAIEVILKGHIYLSKHAREIVFKEYLKLGSRKKSLISNLSEDEKRVIDAFIKGESPEKIADMLDIKLDVLFEISSGFIRQWIQSV